MDDILTVQLENALGGARPCLKGTPSELQQQFDGLIELLSKDAPPPDNSVSTKDGSVDGIKYRIYTPVEAASKGPLPVGVFTHGGGFVVGNLDSEDVLCRVVAQHTPCIIVSVDYRLGPEHKLPVMVEDTITVYNWVCNGPTILFLPYIILNILICLSRPGKMLPHMVVILPSSFPLVVALVEALLCP